jgi:hypothetical protein
MTCLKFTLPCPTLRAACALALGACLLAGGCGQSLPSVSGKVTYHDAPLAQGRVTLHPEGKGAPGYGTIRSDGSYDIKTGSNAGVAPGQYKITVSATEPAPEPTPQNPVPVAKSLIPLRYAKPETSGLEITVVAGSNQRNIELND